ncbi:hypothetical protein PHYSODRAFT_519260 [Phytophthora sojae]|uniref:Uncharacterized protein n=1 Tax=Phytophthora sojae (strain P6497) TaxID=1094619 RepID=G5A224_PHYSP|nr:hypothetical protein PHYSODRAFT_519260 [Phytophthora sojae]EGZ10972.1 hypothetical protein PHYSODRAFT_519260 [Phytophthora sojae]|eukprot:XP_009533717.1 hypothetical protein PHYSODRAFT_519260 [Phytophthora sojae]
MVQLQPTRLAESKSAEALDAPPRRMNPAIAVAGLIIPPPPSVPPPADNSRKASNIDKDPDIAAKAVLRDLTNEIDQLVATSTSSVEEDEALTRMLSDKYIHARLSKLSGTPFVQLVRKKSLQRLTPDQHKTLQSLLQLPEKQLLRLPKAQLELVQFAKRYEKLVKATPDQLRHLPIEHQQLVRSVQQQQKQLTRADERR